MTGIPALWLPILLSAVLVFVMSSVIHAATPWHKADYPRLPDEDKVMDALRPFGMPPGDYMVPRPATRRDMKSPEFADKLRRGPVMVLTVLPNGGMAMGRNMAFWFAYLVVVGVIAAYIAGRSLPPGAEHTRVLHLVGTAAFTGYAVAMWQMSIWYRRAWGTTIRATVDGVVYAIITAVTFASLWPR